MPDEDPICSVTEQLNELKHKYERLKESHLKLLDLNHNLEDKLLQNICHFEDEKFSLIHNIKSLNFQLEEVRQLNRILNGENERFKSDISVAVQLLHCKPSNFSSCKIEDLPTDFKSKAKCHVQKELTKSRSERKGKVVYVPNSAFPSTTVIYSVTPEEGESDPRVDSNVVSALTMAKILEERQIDLQNKTILSSQHLANAVSFLQPSLTVPYSIEPRYVDHGTQTYPIFIGDSDKTRNTCIFCQGSSPSLLIPPILQSTRLDSESAQIDAEPRKNGKQSNHRHKFRPSCSVVNSASTFSQTFRETEI